MDGFEVGLGEGCDDGCVGLVEGASDGISLGDSVGSNAQRSMRHLRPVFVLRVSKISQNSSRKIASSVPV